MRVVPVWDDFESFMQARHADLLRRAYLLTGQRQTAEDVVQTTLTKLYLSWDKIRDREQVDAYARRILVNETNSLWRKPWRTRERSSEEAPEASRCDEYDEGAQGEMWSLLLTLPTRQRQVLVLRYYEQLTEAEIADVLRISVGTVKSSASRGLTSLRSRAGATSYAHARPHPRGERPIPSAAPSVAMPSHVVRDGREEPSASDPTQL